MNFGEAQTEMYARGFDYLNQDAAGRTRAKRFIVEAYLEDVCANEPWDFLRASTSSTAPLTITDLDTVISARDETNDRQLDVVDAGYLEDQFGDLTETGTATFLYFTGETALTTFPLDTGATIGVKYFKIPTEPSADDDTFLVPSRWHGIIIDFAVVRAYVDSDNFEAAQWLENRAQVRLAKMRETEMVRSPHPGTFVNVDFWGW